MSTDLTDRLRDSLAHHAGTTPAPSIDVDTLIGRGRRARQVRRTGTLAAAVIAVVVLIGGIFVAEQAMSQRQVVTPVHPKPPLPGLKLTLPAVGDCPAGTYGFVDNVSSSGNHQLVLTPTPKTPQNKVGDVEFASHDFNNDGRPEVLRKITCQVTGTSRQTEAVVALSGDGAATPAIALGNAPVVTNPVTSPGDIRITTYFITQSSISGGPAHYIVQVTGQNGGTYTWDNNSWVRFGG
jgi:hypothetical protein